MSSNKSIVPFEIYCDGSAKGNDAAHRLGGWAYLIMWDKDIKRKDSGTVVDTTNQRMELLACIEAIKGALILGDEDSIYKIYSDSAYLINCWKQGWYLSWEKNGWKNARKEPVANADLWAELLPYFKNRAFEFNKVKGHADDHYNNIVDEMAQDACQYSKVRSANG
jgi:ribonuclease HI